MIVKSKGGIDAFSTEWNARTGVHGYGGGAAMAYGGKIYFSDWKSRKIHVIDDSNADAGPSPVTPGKFS